MTKSCKELQHLMEKVYRERGYDFREYRETTLTRRLARRLHATGAKTYTDYARVLDADSNEYSKLFDDLTINVTNFFRDGVAFKVLEEVVFPTMLINRCAQKRKSLQIWSAGCATGQEPYSIAMLLSEIIGQEIKRWDITIMATDIDGRALEYAGIGIFSPEEVKGIRPTWLKKCFLLESRCYRVQPSLRQLVTFKDHNLVSDPPYYDLDLVVCRNVLIYFTPGLQARVLKNFYDGLKEGGFLLLGKAEVPVGETKALFHCLDGKAKLYQKVD